MSQTLIPSVSPTLLAFKPRQVLLSQHTMMQKNDSQTPKSSGDGASLQQEQRTLLLHAVAFFLDRNGFSKTLKKFRSEAKIEKDFSKDLLISLEEMCHKHLKKCSQAIATQNKPDEETVKEVVDDRGSEAQEEPTKKSKDKKKTKKNTVPETHADTAEKEKPEPVPSEGTTVHEEVGKKSKDKKKKKNKEKSVTDAKILDEDEHNDNSKKRKRLTSEDNGSHTVDEKETEDIKRRKVGVQSTKVNTSVTDNGLSEQTNEYVERTAEKTSTKKALKHSNGSTEPKTINAFQRVKVDTVTFADEKLADNSYWAKGGADTGYGAKAQEVLGQVKGRDFRHEKTKKKRGSYRGGVIDLQSHSVKFNYSDDE